MEKSFIYIPIENLDANRFSIACTFGGAQNTLLIDQTNQFHPPNEYISCFCVAVVVVINL